MVKVKTLNITIIDKKYFEITINGTSHEFSIQNKPSQIIEKLRENYFIDDECADTISCAMLVNLLMI